jgi:hypothetical protein
MGLLKFSLDLGQLVASAHAQLPECERPQASSIGRLAGMALPIQIPEQASR